MEIEDWLWKRNFTKIPWTSFIDTKMGSIDRAIECPIDEQDNETCPGYFSKISLQSQSSISISFHILKIA